MIRDAKCTRSICHIKIKLTATIDLVMGDEAYLHVYMHFIRINNIIFLCHYITYLFFLFVCFQQWELIVLSKLKWNISSVTPLDFLEHLLIRLPISNRHTDISKIKKHAQAFISLAARGKLLHQYITTLWLDIRRNSNYYYKFERLLRKAYATLTLIAIITPAKDPCTLYMVLSFMW